MFGPSEASLSVFFPMRQELLMVYGRWEDGTIAHPSATFWIIVLRKSNSSAQTMRPSARAFSMNWASGRSH